MTSKSFVVEDRRVPRSVNEIWVNGGSQFTVARPAPSIFRRVCASIVKPASIPTLRFARLFRIAPSIPPLGPRTARSFQPPEPSREIERCPRYPGFIVGRGADKPPAHSSSAQSTDQLASINKPGQQEDHHGTGQGPNIPRSSHSSLSTEAGGAAVQRQVETRRAESESQQSSPLWGRRQQNWPVLNRMNLPALSNKLEK